MAVAVSVLCSPNLIAPPPYVLTRSNPSFAAKPETTSNSKRPAQPNHNCAQA